MGIFIIDLIVFVALVAFVLFEHLSTGSLVITAVVATGMIMYHHLAARKIKKQLRK